MRIIGSPLAAGSLHHNVFDAELKNVLNKLYLSNRQFMVKLKIIHQIDFLVESLKVQF